MGNHELRLRFLIWSFPLLAFALPGMPGQGRVEEAQGKAEVDKLTIAGCPKERQAMLKHLDADTLGETVF